MHLVGWSIWMYDDARLIYLNVWWCTVDLFECMMMHGFTNPKVCRVFALMLDCRNMFHNVRFFITGLWALYRSRMRQVFPKQNFVLAKKRSLGNALFLRSFVGPNYVCMLVTAGEVTLLSINVWIFVVWRVSKYGFVARNNPSLSSVSILKKSGGGDAWNVIFRKGVFMSSVPNPLVRHDTYVERERDSTLKWLKAHVVLLILQH